MGMDCLWLTLADPDPPMNGQFLYSSGLIRAAAAGAVLEVAGFSLPGGRHRDGQRTGATHWHLVPLHPLPRWREILSRFPVMVSRTRTPDLRRKLKKLLCARDWDAIVFDSISLGWALAEVKAKFGAAPTRPMLVYIAHNHEASVSRSIAAAERRAAQRLYRYVEALRFGALEKALVRNATLVTSNTLDDCAKFRADAAEKPIEFLPPGYSGMVTRRRIGADLPPRRAIIVGSFDWIAKRQSIVEFLRIADPIFARAGIELEIVGQAEPSFLEQLRAMVKATRLTGRVEDVTLYMRNARLALVPDRTPGFKLKGLDYVFNGLPIFALAGSLPGMPLADGESIRYFPDYELMAEAVCQSIDDVESLDAMQSRAYAACAGEFDWDAIGRRLVAAVARCAGQHRHSEDGAMLPPSPGAGLKA